ncbi:stalk domain-containing protein [Paenibacillus caseinilyticus]|nr:stalk domain-containing protein [Paenibacillus caseinilyticus]MCZ8521005.1 stalk domain-containing protein [Paenibacillus caseinilyticus]
MLIGSLLLVIFLFGSYPSARIHAAAAQQPVKVFVDTTRISFEIEPLLIDGTTLVQFRPLFEGMGMKVKWDEAQRLVTGSQDGLTIELRIDEPYAAVNGRKVELSQGARIVDGSTMVPLRFIGEATGAIVHWDPVNREISVVTDKLLASLGMTKEEMLTKLADYAANQQTPPAAPQEPAPGAQEPAPPVQEPQPSTPAAPVQPAKPVDLSNLQGMYYGFRDDFGGYECGGACWDLYTFLPDSHILIGAPPQGGPETIDCTRDKCSTYTIAEGKLQVSDGTSYSIEVSQAGDLSINGILMTAVVPAADGTILQGSYKYISYYGLVGINAYSTSSTEYLSFSRDGTFESTDLSIASLDVIVSGTQSSSSKSDTGTYSIAGNTITLKYEDGTTVRRLFFDHDPGGPDTLEDIQVGDSRFYIPED